MQEILQDLYQLEVVLRLYTQEESDQKSFGLSLYTVPFFWVLPLISESKKGYLGILV